MISNKLYLSLSSNFQVLCNRVAKLNVAHTWRLRYYDGGYQNITVKPVISMSCYCTVRNKDASSKPIVAKKKMSMTEEDRTALETWLEMCKFQGLEVPQQISEQQFQQLYEADSKHKRNKYLHFLVMREKDCINSKIEKETGKAFRAELRKEREIRSQGHIQYRLWKNSMFSKVNKRHFVDLGNHRLISAMKFGQPLVFDLDFEEYLRGRQIMAYVKQLSMCITQNRSNDDPFNLTFCNVNFNSDKFKKFTTQMSGVLNPSFPINISSESYLDLFPKEKLVYLSPDAREVMKVFDHNAIYIIGGIVDHGKNVPLTLAKAKKEKIKMQKLPLDRFSIFKGSKSLNINIMLTILLNVKNDGDWRKAFQTVSEFMVESKHS